MDTAKVRSAVVELDQSMTRADAERDFQKEKISAVAEEQGIDKRVLRKMARAYHKSNFQDEAAQNDEFETIYTNVMS